MAVQPVPDPIPNGANFGYINEGETTAPVQVAPFSENAGQTNNITNAAVGNARASIDDLRGLLEEMRGQHPELEAALRDLAMIASRLNGPERDPGTLRYMLQNLIERCGGFPNLVAAAQLVQSTVMALLPGT